MNTRTAKLLHAQAALVKVPERSLKRHWLSLPRNRRHDARLEMERFQAGLFLANRS